MKILVVHNTYQHRGGEDTVVESEIELLRTHGHSVEFYSRDNNDIKELSKLEILLQTFWSKRSANEIDSLISEFAPDVIHIHNTFPLISPSIYWVAKKNNIAVIQTLHNYRLLCPQAMFLRKAKVCEECLGKIPWRGVIRGCYRDSLLQTGLLASMLVLHRVIGTWRNKVTRYIVLNKFCRDKFIKGGISGAQISIKPNFSLDINIKKRIRKGYLFVGRLSCEKGIDVLLATIRTMDGVSLTIIGSGDEESKFIDVDGVTMLGHLSKKEIYEHMQSARALIIPSICYETFGMVAIEAFANNLPVIASRIGVLPDIVKDRVNGLLFNPGDSNDLLEKIRWSENNSSEWLLMGNEARINFETYYTAEKNYLLLISIYNDAIKETVHDMH